MENAATQMNKIERLKNLAVLEKAKALNRKVVKLPQGFSYETKKMLDGIKQRKEKLDNKIQYRNDIPQGYFLISQLREKISKLKITGKGKKRATIEYLRQVDFTKRGKFKIYPWNEKLFKELLQK